MFTGRMVSRTGQHVLDLFGFNPAKKPERAKLRCRIKEVIYGQRPAVKLYSRRLHAELWLINEGLVDPAAEMFQGRAVTMQELAELMLERDKSRQFCRENYLPGRALVAAMPRRSGVKDRRHSDRAVK